MILGAVTVFTGVSFGAAYFGQTGAQAPESVIVDGQPTNLHQGRFFLFFYHPACPHCNHAAAAMSKYQFREDITVVAIPVGEQQWAADFLKDNNFTVAKTSLDKDPLREAFTFDNYPHAVVIERGRQTAMVLSGQFDDDKGLETLLRGAGAIQ